MPTRDLRPVLHWPHFVWGWGYGLPIPRPLSTWLVRGWNRTACRFTGHDDVLWHLEEAGYGNGMSRCVHCSRPIQGCTGYGVEHTS